MLGPTRAATTLPLFLPQSPPDQATGLIHDATLLAQVLGQRLPRTRSGGRTLGSRAFRAATEAAFGGPDAEGVWVRKDAYEALEAAQVLFLRKFGTAMQSRPGCAAATLQLLTRLAEGVRLIAITHPRKRGVGPKHPAWRESLVCLQQKRLLVFTATIAGRAYVRQGTTIGTRLTGLPTARPGAERVIGRLVTPEALDRVHEGLGVGGGPQLSPADTWSVVVERGAVLDLAGGLQFHRALVMGMHRVDLTGFSDGGVAQSKAPGLASEIIAWHLRLFVPNAEDRGPAILGAILDRHPLFGARARAAA